MADLIVKINGRQLAGWTSVQIQRSIEQVAGSATLGVSEREAGKPISRRVHLGAFATISLGSERIFTGRVEGVRRSYDQKTHTVSITLRSLTGALVVCGRPEGPYEWREAGIEQIAKDLVKPFSLSAFGGSDEAPLRVFRFQPGETVAKALGRGARQRALLVTDTPGGNLRLTRAGGSSVGSIVYGRDILKGEIVASHRDRFSTYIIKGEAPTLEWGNPEEAITRQGRAEDKGIGYYRPNVRLAETPMAPERLTQRAEWERATRYGKGIQVQYTLQGWTNPKGGVWAPNQGVEVEDEVMGYLRERLTVVGVQLSIDVRSGTLAQLKLSRPTAFTVEPWLEPEEVMW